MRQVGRGKREALAGVRSADERCREASVVGGSPCKTPTAPAWVQWSVGGSTSNRLSAPPVCTLASGSRPCPLRGQTTLSHCELAPVSLPATGVPGTASPSLTRLVNHQSSQREREPEQTAFNRPPSPAHSRVHTRPWEPGARQPAIAAECGW